MSGDENLWYVKTADGDVHRVTLDQLDEAFQAGRIDENVMVLPTGATRWAKLADLAGLDEPPPPPPAPRMIAAPPVALASSLRPVSLDLSLDVDENLFRKKSRKGLVIGGMVAILAAFGGFLALNRGHFALDSSAAAAAVVVPPPAEAAPPPVPAAAPPPVATPAPSASADPNASKLNDDQKAKLAAADKALDLKTKAKKKSHAGSGSASHGYSGKSKTQGFTTGGKQVDPLNASF